MKGHREKLEMPWVAEMSGDDVQTRERGRHSVEASLEDIITRDVNARLGKYLEEEAVRQDVWNSARVAGWVGLILILMLIVVLVEALQNKPLSFSY